jgi:uncharacterized protein YjbI with pentapeptide repeats
MVNQEQDLASLIAKFEQLEERQNITAKYAVKVKRQLDELTKKINSFQARFEQQSELSNDLNTAKSNGLVSSEITVVEHITDGVKSIMSDNSSVMLTASVEAQLNDNVDEIDTLVQQELSVTAFTNEEFKIARMTQLLNAYGDLLLLKAYLAEENSLDLPLNIGEFWKQYNSGKRNFTGVNLAGVDLNRCPSKANLSRANLTRAKLSGNWSTENLSGANLSRANLSGANLSRANLSEANLSRANLSEANLSRANLTKADLRGADLSNAHLEKANLKDANLDGAIMSGVQLTGAIMPDSTTHE